MGWIGGGLWGKGSLKGRENDGGSMARTDEGRHDIFENLCMSENME